MAEPSLFGEEITPAVYCQTRVLPLGMARELVREVVRFTSELTTLRNVVDIGCGCGRLLAGLALCEGRFDVLGIDVSERMLDAVPAWVLRSGRCRLQAGDCRRRSVLARESFDLVLMHWVLNTTEAWAAILENATRWVRGRGAIAWFEEESNLYEAVDGRALAVGVDDWSDFELAFWERWYGALGEDVPEGGLAGRVGLPMKSHLAEAELASAGYRIASLEGASRSWSRLVTVDWIVKQVLLPRAFSNMWQLPERHWHRSVEALRAFVSRYEVANSARTVLRFRSTPMVAILGGLGAHRTGASLA